MADLNILQTKINQWAEILPIVKPFYAIKCHPNKEMIKMMLNHNMGFDCASQKEIQTVLDLGAKPSDVIFAHPVKRIDDLKYAVENNVKLTTFDSLSELQKLKKFSPNMDCLIRLQVDNPTARVQLGLKYGVNKDEYRDLIDAAKKMNLNIIGTSFHVGSAGKEPSVFNDGIDFCREVFDYAKKKGYIMNLLDIGGGFTNDNFKECATVIKDSVIKNNFNDTTIIAEPGRYFAEDVFTFCVNVNGHRKRNGRNEYWITDGLYGSFNCVLYDGQVPNFEALRNPLLEIYDGGNDLEESVINFQTCDSADRLGCVRLPYLRVGDFLMVRSFGAYTLAGACDFNGINFTNPKIFYI
jgi:ornithine decarboxylase